MQVGLSCCDEVFVACEAVRERRAVFGIHRVSFVAKKRVCHVSGVWSQSGWLVSAVFLLWGRNECERCTICSF